MERIPKPVHGSLEWLAIRHRNADGHVTFGASEAGALMGVSEYTTLADLCMSKLYPPEYKEPEAQMVKGIIFEAPLLEEAGRQLGCDVVTPDVMFRKGKFTVTLDGLATQFGETDPFLIVEAKVTAAYTVASPDDLPRAWVMQGHVQQWVLGLPVTFVVFDKRQNINLIHMPFDEDLMEHILNTADMVAFDLDNGVMPDYAYRELTADQVQRLYPVKERRSITASDDLVNHIFDLQTIRKQIRLEKELEAETENAIARLMQDAEDVVDADGNVLFSWREQKGRSSFDTKGFQQAYPDLYAEFVKQGNPYRVMRFGKGK